MKLAIDLIRNKRSFRRDRRRRRRTEAKKPPPHLLNEGNGDGGAAAPVAGELVLPPLLHGPLVASSVRLGAVTASGHLAPLLSSGGTLAGIQMEMGAGSRTEPGRSEQTRRTKRRRAAGDGGWPMTRAPIYWRQAQPAPSLLSPHRRNRFPCRLD